MDTLIQDTRYNLPVRQAGTQNANWIVALAFILLLLISAQPAFAFKAGDTGIRINGFIEGAAGYKFKDDTTKHDDYNLAEARLQLKTRYYPEKFLAEYNPEINIKAEFLVDGYFSGKTDAYLREASCLFTPFSFMDIKAGRQAFTWGTGDYLFINDLFPKDYISFFAGRQDEYLKMPSDGIKFSVYNEKANFDIVAIPFFQPNAIPNGERLSFFDSFQQGIAGRESDRFIAEPPLQPSNGEYALRVYRTFSSYEAALYGFYGFYKMPRGYKNEMARELFYPRLAVYGFSVRGPAFGGIGNIEFGYYDSLEDRGGTNRLIENSSVKALAGYEKDLGSDWRIGVQYMYEQTLDYSEYKEALLAQDFFWDESRHLLTARITKLLLNQTLKISLFTFYSPSDNDAYLRPVADYDFRDNIKLTLGANLIWGEEDKTEFGQFERDSNIYARVKWSF